MKTPEGSMPPAPVPAWSRWRTDVSRLACWCVVLLASVVFAAPRVVRIETDGPDEDVRAFRRSLLQWFSSMQVLVDDAASAPDARVVARWSNAVCTVEVFRADGSLVRSKDVPRSGAAVLVSESAALLAQSGVEVVLAEPPPEVKPVPEAVPLVEAQALAPSPPAARLALGAYLQARSYDAMSPVVFGGGAEVAFTWLRDGLRPDIALLGNYQGPLGTPGFDLQLQQVSIRLLPGVEHAFGDFDLGAGVGGGLDVLLASTQDVDRADAAPFISGALFVRWHFTRVSTFFARVLIDGDPAPRRYVVLDGGQKKVLLEPWSVRPALQLGFTFELPLGGRP